MDRLKYKDVLTALYGYQTPPRGVPAGKPSTVLPPPPPPPPPSVSTWGRVYDSGDEANDSTTFEDHTTDAQPAPTKPSTIQAHYTHLPAPSRIRLVLTHNNRTQSGKFTYTDITISVHTPFIEVFPYMLQALGGTSPITTTTAPCKLTLYLKATGAQGITEWIRQCQHHPNHQGGLQPPPPGPGSIKGVFTGNGARLPGHLQFVVADEGAWSQILHWIDESTCWTGVGFTVAKA